MLSLTWAVSAMRTIKFNNKLPTIMLIAMYMCVEFARRQWTQKEERENVRIKVLLDAKLIAALLATMANYIKILQNRFYFCTCILAHMWHPCIRDQSGKKVALTRSLTSRSKTAVNLIRWVHSRLNNWLKCIKSQTDKMKNEYRNWITNNVVIYVICCLESNLCGHQHQKKKNSEIDEECARERKKGIKFQLLTDNINTLYTQ